MGEKSLSRWNDTERDYAQKCEKQDEAEPLASLFRRNCSAH